MNEIKLGSAHIAVKDAPLSFTVKKKTGAERIIALAGNPNVGKSTVFNALTGLRQHTGNWPGKTVTNAQGYFESSGSSYVLVDLPGAYSLTARSSEEEAARDFLLFGGADAVVVVCDATCLERNLNLVLQIMELTQQVIVCVNLMDEAKKKGISVDLDGLSRRLGVPVIGAAARSGSGLDTLTQNIDSVLRREHECPPFRVHYPDYIEAEVSELEPIVEQICGGAVNSRWLSLRLLSGDEASVHSVEEHLNAAIQINPAIIEALPQDYESLSGRISDDIAASIVQTAEYICENIVAYSGDVYASKDRALDNLFTSRRSGFLIMLLGLLFILWLTISGANYPSRLLSVMFSRLESILLEFAASLGVPVLLSDMLVLGMYRTLTWVVSVMLPPMAIFFPLFTLLEDVGYLPRIAFNLDRCFQKCNACGKQALTMCMVCLILYIIIYAS